MDKFSCPGVLLLVWTGSSMACDIYLWLQTLVDGIPVCIRFVEAGFVGLCSACKNNFSIRLTTPRQVIQVVTVGLAPATFDCKTSAMTTGSLTVPDMLLLKDHVQTEG